VPQLQNAVFHELEPFSLRLQLSERGARRLLKLAPGRGERLHLYSARAGRGLLQLVDQLADAIEDVLDRESGCAESGLLQLLALRYSPQLADHGLELGQSLLDLLLDARTPQFELAPGAFRFRQVALNALRLRAQELASGFL